jgi:hypothetical protein
VLRVDGQRCGLVALELEKGVSVVLDDELDVFALAVESIAGHHRALKIDALIEPLGGGEFALGLGGFAFGFFGGDGDGDGRAAFVLAEREGEQEVADVFAVQRQRAQQGSVMGGESAV